MLESDFSYDERKSKENELEAFDNPYFSLNFILHNVEIIGYICFWDFNKAVKEFVYNF